MIFVLQFSGEGRVTVPGCAWDFGCLWNLWVQGYPLQDWIFQEKIPASLLCQTLLDASCRDYFVDMKYMERAMAKLWTGLIVRMVHDMTHLAFDCPRHTYANYVINVMVHSVRLDKQVH